MRAALIALLLTIASQAGAGLWDPDNFRLGEVASVSVELNDEATNACWTNLREAREYAEEKLRMKKVKIDNNQISVSRERNTYQFMIEVHARRIRNDGTGPCVGSVNILVFTIGLVNGSIHVLSSGGMESLQLRPTNLNQAVIEAINNFTALLK